MRPILLGHGTFLNPVHQVHSDSGFSRVWATRSSPSYLAVIEIGASESNCAMARSMTVG